MTIAVHIYFTGIQKTTFTNFNYRCFTLLAANNPHDHFIFIFDKPFEQSIILQSNITPVVLTPQIKNRLLQHYWYNYKIPRLLNKYNATVFVSGDCICSLRTTIPQCMMLHDISFLQKNNLYARSESRYLRKYSKSFINKANQVMVSNSYLPISLKTLFPEANNKINIISPGIDDGFESNADNKGKELKEKLTGGREYFLFYGTGAASENTIMMLKAFSLFKKWQKSNMCLILLFVNPEKKNIREDLATYKYRDDVCIISDENNETTEILISAAYTVIYLPGIEMEEPELLYTMKHSIPLIATEGDFWKSIYKNGALYTKLSEKDISEKMMLLYKNENQRNEIAARGRSIAAEYTWQHAAGLVWKTMQTAALQ